MPKVTKLHAKGKSTTLQKPCKVDKGSPDNVEPEESMRLFQLELCWCIQQLERSLREKKSNEKQMQEAWKVLTVLKNNSQPIIRKRQLMRTHFGDYRAKMAAEEKKLAKMASKIKISESPVQPKATFLRKSAFLTTGDNLFRFGFDLTPDQIDDNKTNDVNDKVNEIRETNEDSNSENKTDVDENKDNKNETCADDNDVANNAEIAKNETKSDPYKVEDKKTISSDNLKGTDPNKFKFTFTKSEFKFNFNVNSDS